ncbi:DarT ssDNA thymidine ADP-ribosyltransferase family protein [Sphingobium sp. R-7]|uniref:DarT ssDNA thymidine ADP-ribosyltransferase family protein n=1 Tax=Sphingobium sp. R-7 TaxID=3375449 RepID=UPI00398B26DD
MTVQEIIDQRGIQEVLHFTTHRGLVGTLASGALQSRYRLPEDKYLQHILHVNSAVRPEAGAFFDKSDNWLDYVNLSISEINRRYFEVSQRWHADGDIWWTILSFDAVVMTHENVVFASTNNSYDLCLRERGGEGLNALFAAMVKRKSPSWTAYRGDRASELPTCEQAEVLYPAAVPMDFLRRVYVREEEHQDQVSGWLEEFGKPAVEVVWSPQKFLGKKN